MKKTLLALATVVLTTTGAAAADSYDRHAPVLTPVQYHERDRASSDDRSATVNEREARIADRIQRGIRDGRINEREARALQRELNQVEAKERGYNRDGRLNSRESEDLNRDLDRLSDHVKQQIRD